jgi:pyridoxal phosphate enzyme (YggS family)
MSLSERLENINQRIALAAQKGQRSVKDVKLIAISKTQPASAVQEALAVGIRDIGENRVQEAEAKILEVGRHSATWHLVGHLQANKARRAVKLFDVIHSLDSPELARRLDRLCTEEGRKELSVLLQVDLGREPTKSGAYEEELPQVLAALQDCSNLRPIGLMTLPPFFEDAENVRPFFRRLRKLRDDLAEHGAFGRLEGELSMGMTHDFEVAIEEGATMVRIGTALFGARNGTAQGQKIC